MAEAAAKKNVDFTEGNIVRKLIVFSVPLILGELFQCLYHSADSVVTGNFVSTAAQAAVNVSTPITDFLVGFFSGMSLGATVLVSRAFGGRNEKKQQTAMRVAFSFSLVLGAVLAVIGVLSAPLFLKIVDVNAEVYEPAMAYLRIFMVGIMFTVIYNVGAGILRAVGDSRSPFIMLVIACTSNILLDLLFTAVLEWGVTGVALATVLAQGLSVVMVYYRIVKTEKTFRIDIRELFSNKKMIRQIAGIGIPAGLQSSITTLSNLFIWRRINGFDSTVITAGTGIATRLDKFVSLPVKSVGQALTVFVGQNCGAGKHDRNRRALWRVLWLSWACAAILGGAVYILARPCVGLFNPEDAVIDIGVAMMHAIIPFYPIMACREALFGMLRGYGDTRIPMYISLGGMVVLRQIFLAVTMHYHHVIENIYASYPFAWTVTSLMILIYYLAKRKKMGLVKKA